MPGSESLAQIASKYYRADDPVRKPHYLHAYDHHFGSMRETPVRVLELGCWEGSSLLMWSDYFSKDSVFVTIDMGQSPPAIGGRPNIKFLQGFQDDPAVMKEACNIIDNEKFDIIIDDCAHVGVTAFNSFNFLFDKALKVGGVYVIEDIGAPFGVKDWPDGAPYAPEVHGIIDGNRIVGYDLGMMGFIKRLVDHVNIQSIPSRFPISCMSLYESIAFVTKRT